MKSSIASNSSCPTPVMHDLESITNVFFTRWGDSYSELCDSFTDIMTEDCPWVQEPLATTKGPVEAIKFMDKSRRFLRLDTIEVEVLSIATNGDIVFSERIDHLYTASGKSIASVPVTGVMQFQGERLNHWREYFDASTLIVGSLKNLLKGTGRT